MLGSVGGIVRGILHKLHIFKVKEFQCSFIQQVAKFLITVLFVLRHIHGTLSSAPSSEK